MCLWSVYAQENVVGIRKVTKSSKSFNFIERLYRQNNNNASKDTPQQNKRNALRFFCAEMCRCRNIEHSNKKQNTKYYNITVVAVVSRVPKMCHVRSFYRNLETITVKQHIKSDGDTEKHTSYEQTKSPPEQRTSVAERKKYGQNGIFNKRKTCERWESSRVLLATRQACQASHGRWSARRTFMWWFSCDSFV